MLAERISLEVICRVMEIKPHGLSAYMDELYDEIPEDLACSIQQNTDIELVKVNCEVDDLCGRKFNKKWLWLALDRNSCQVIALFVDDRSEGTVGSSTRAIPRAGHVLHRRAAP